MVITANEFLEYSGAPGDATWSTELIDNNGNGFTFSAFEKDDSNNKSCTQNPGSQFCGGGYVVNVLFNHPNLEALVILVDYSESSDKKPNIDRYETILGSITLPQR